MKLFDTHAHLLDARFDADREELIASFGEKGVAHVIECGCTAADCARVIALTEAYPGLIYGACGIHPEMAAEAVPGGLAGVERALEHKCVVAVGEIGLDYHYDDGAPREVQRALFGTQVELAVQKRLPVIVHDRDAHGDTLDILKAFRGRAVGVLHCFSGSFETAKEALDLGWYIGVGGSSTFKNSRRLKEMLPKLPADRLLLETDCPYMAPEPFRGERNDPTLTAWTCRHLAELLGRDAEELSEQLYGNACGLFGIGE